MRSFRFLPALAAVALCAGAAPATAQDPHPVAGAEDPTSLDDILVVGEPHARLARRYVETIGAPVRDRPLATWRRSVCVSVANLPADAAQYLVDRVSALAQELGLQPGEPGCTANVVVIATDDGPGLADALVRENFHAFAVSGRRTNLSRSALEVFRTSAAPVRWWHVAMQVDSDTGARVNRLPGEQPRAVSSSRASRLRSDIRDDLNKVVIIIDVDQLEGTTFEQLADYVSMVAMAQVDAQADTAGLPSILNLFDDPEGVPGLSEWDRAYLHALYGVEPGRTSRMAQTGALVRLMVGAEAGSPRSAR